MEMRRERDVLQQSLDGHIQETGTPLQWQRYVCMYDMSAYVNPRHEC